MARTPSSASEWTAAVETAVQAELLHHSRRLKWVALLALVLAVAAVALALATRGMRWDELAPRLREQAAPLLATQIAQGQLQIEMAAELDRLQAELRRIEGDLHTHIGAPDRELQALQRRVLRLERTLADAARVRAEQRVGALPAAASAAGAGRP